MLERLFGKSERTRFENHVESKLILPYMSALRLKEKELISKAESYGPESLDYSKYKIVNLLLSHIDEKVSQFNKQPILPHHEAETKALIDLIYELYCLTKGLKIAFDYELKKNRNSQRWLASTLLWGGTLAATYVAVSALSFSTLGVGATVLIGGNTASSCIQSVTGLDDQRSASFRIIDDLETTLHSTWVNLIKITEEWENKGCGRKFK